MAKYKQKWMKKGKPKQGIFIPKNIEKYILVENAQNNGRIEYRSSWELMFMNWCDMNEAVIKWSSEPFAIHYIKPTDAKKHKYYIDFYFEAKNSKGEIIKYIIEIKPYSETKPPELPKRKTEKSMMNYHKKLMTYQINQAKWNAAKKFAEENGLNFMIITEYELGIK